MLNTVKSFMMKNLNIGYLLIEVMSIELKTIPAIKAVMS